MMDKISNKITAILLSIVLSSYTSVAVSNVTTKETPTPTTSADSWNNGTLDMLKMLHSNPTTKLQQMQAQAADDYHAAWYQLALITKRDSRNTRLLSSDLIIWRDNHPIHPANELLPDDDILHNLLHWEAPQQIAVLLPESGGYASAARKVRKGIMNAYYKNIELAGRQNIKFYDTEAPNVVTAYKKAIDDGADFIIGPLDKEQVFHLSMLDKFDVPTLALNYSRLNIGSLPINFFEFGLLPEDEAVQMAELARRSGKMNALIIAPETAWGKRMVAAFKQEWQQNGGEVKDTWLYNSKMNFKRQVAKLLKIDLNLDKKLMEENNSREALEEQRRQDFDAVFLFTSQKRARAILPLLRYYYVRAESIYASSSILDLPLNPTRDTDFNNVIVCHLPASTKSAHINHNYLASDKLYSLGKDAYLLSQSFIQLIEMPYIPVYGATGALALSYNQQIHRSLPCNAIKGGKIETS